MVRSLLILSFALVAASSLALELGDRLPRELPDLDRIQGDAGTLVVVGSPDCTPSLDRLDALAGWADALRSQGLRMVWVEPAERRFAESRFPIVVSDRFPIAAGPQAFLFDGSGQLVYRGDVEGAERASRALIDRREIADAERPVRAGCDD